MGYGTHTRARTYTYIHTYIARIVWSASSGLLSRRDRWVILECVDRFNGIFKWHARPYLHSTPCGPPTKFFSQEMHYDPAWTFYDGGPGSCGHVLRKLWEGEKRDSRATPYLRVCWSNNAFSLEAGQIFVGFVFVDLSFNVALIDSYVEFITFQRKISLARRSICNNVASVWKKIFNFNISYHALSIQCEKYYGLMGKKHVEHFIQ